MNSYNLIKLECLIKIVNDNNIFKDKMVNSTIHIAKQIINRNKKYRVGQRSIIISALFDKTLKKQ